MAEEKKTVFPAGSRPAWLRKRVLPGERARQTGRILSGTGVSTVCAAAGCPNQSECYGQGVAAFLILGTVCTRRCRFCGVSQGQPGPCDPREAENVAEAVRKLGIEYAVVTSVTRDDLPDGGARGFVLAVEAIRAKNPGVEVEVLTPDFGGCRESVTAVVSAGPAVYNHNLETVPCLYPEVRPGASYRRSLGVLEDAARAGAQWTKSGIMVGLGESAREVRAVMADLRNAGCRIMTIGQYLAPGRDRLPVRRYVTPDEFRAYEEEARSLGFEGVASGPFVRSSHFAGALFSGLRQKRPAPGKTEKTEHSKKREK